MGSCPSLGYEPHNIECFTGEEVETEDGHAELKKPEQDKQKDQGKKLAQINLAIRKREPQPIFISANFSAELRQAILAFLQEFKDIFTWT